MSAGGIRGAYFMSESAMLRRQYDNINKKWKSS